ncbi:polysaccharide pyruvyl transferase family protein [Colwellia sp. BRX10-6]|uniref:polysaccharide pyruvyl transferase family protein n=1 Tax=unclassified Colwellia TaxID=196834 RepID=UPI0015F7374A|nr:MULTISPECIES: polysaccharide pyruvyl transferase family protein [unclassified Colwellia]MBA6384479.1 polysaccharide pyruvyl transferase family protein [Colwellia sp. BRX10-9]MBA6396039.1 polysaccharide pyruvyl transferase family protein [Colwellia sp. BRX10-6]
MNIKTPGLLLDTSISTLNLGDEIIVDSVRKEMEKTFVDKGFFRAPAQEKISIPTYRVAKRTDIQLVCGTNLLNGNMPFYKQWKIDFLDTFFLKKICLVGVGWWQYQENINLYSRTLLKRALSKDLTHSVRDSYTLSKLKSIGINNVLNTSCATMWCLTDEHCRKITTNKSNNVVFTLTDYKPSKNSDKSLIEILLSNYENVYFWPQGSRDLVYINSLDIDISNVKILPFSLAAYDELLKSEIDFVGTRLHAGIRALQNNRKTLILAVDNRAEEKRRDFNLPVLERNDISAIKDRINSKWATEIKIPNEEIALWRKNNVELLEQNDLINMASLNE